MRHLILISILFLTSSWILQAQKPLPVYSIVKEDRPHSFFVEQAELWWKEIEKDRSNEKAWYNYYRANRYARMTFGNCNTPECQKYSNWIDESRYMKDLDEIVALIEKEVPNTYTYYILQKDGWHDEERYAALQKAYALEPDNPDTYDELVVYFEISGQAQKRAEFNQLWFQSNEVSPGILNYNYNVMMSMARGGVLLTFGDNDTFPIWMLQDALGLRKDITVLNVHLLGIREYREAQFKKLGIRDPEKEYPENAGPEILDQFIAHIIQNKPEDLAVYTSTPAWKNFREYEGNMYLIGLVLAYSEKNLDNIALLKNNFENKYALDYIGNQFSYDIGRGVAEKTNVNYLPGIIKLYEHYTLSGNSEKAAAIKSLGLLIAEKGGEDWNEKAKKALE